MARTNREILTRGKNYATKQAKKFGSDEVTFDKDSRLDFLTGFHKRKVARQKKAQEFHKEQDRLQKIEERKKIREERKQQIDEQLKQFKAGLALNISDDEDDETKDKAKAKANAKAKQTKNLEEEEWEGFKSDGEEEEDGNGEEGEEGDGVKPILKKNTEYSDNTVVEIETLEPNENFEYLAQVNNVKLEKSEQVLKQSITRATKYAKFLGMGDEEKKKKKKFRYLTKGERRVNQMKANSNKRRR
ncbi:hypothetical protein RNJ44_04066 [Nakaseomyces bracarensis]|uniref:Rrp17p n=1 Tax=Nakaseomyces bracarensis TaxID=273131 RepID=A0ABR4NTU7_9SACH